MKLRIKIVLLTALLLLMAVIVFTLFYLLYRNDPLNRTANALPEVNGSELFSEVDPPDAQRNFQRRTVQLALPEQSVERYGLAGEVEAAGVEIVKAILAPDAVVTVKGSPDLLDSATAVISGMAAIPARGSLPEKHCRFRVKVHILPGGGCEAAFPEFFTLQKNQHPAVGNPR